MEIRRRTLHSAAIAAVTIAFAGSAAAVAHAVQDKSSATQASRDQVERAISGWPAGPHLAVEEMMVKYGPPQEVTPDRVIWHNAGPFKRIMATRQEFPHDFPITHMDYLEHTIDYKVPADKREAVHALDGSITIYPVAGELSARCDLESNNVLTLNLAHDIISGKKTVDEARKAFGEAVSNRTLGNPPPSTQTLQFQPEQQMAAANRDKTTIPGTPQRESEKTGAVGTSGRTATASTTDAQIMAQLIALDENEVRAAMVAEQKKPGQQYLDFARTLHQDHGKDIAATQQLGIKIGSTPAEGAEVQKIHDKGATALAKLVPLKGDEFGPAFADAMIKGHQDALQMIDHWMKSAQNNALKQQLTDARKHVEAHLKQAQQLTHTQG